MPQSSVHPNRKMASVLIANSDAGRWVTLTKALELPPEGGKFVGYVTAVGDDLGLLDLINADNTGGKVVGFIHASINPVFTQIGLHERSANPSFLHAVGLEVFLITDLTAHFLIKVEGDITAVKNGMSYDLAVVAGEQRLNVASPGGPVIVVDEVTEASRGFVRVKLNSAAVA